MKTLKANKKEQKFYRDINKALDLVKEVLEYRYSNRHRAVIAFNCRVYNFPDLEEIHRRIRRLDIDGERRKELLEEWNEDFMWNEYNQHLSDQARWYLEFQSYDDKSEWAMDAVDTDVTGTFGRSGGQMGLCKASEFDSWEDVLEDMLESYFIDSGKQLIIKHWTDWTRNDWVDQHDFIVNGYELSDITDKCRQVLWLIGDGEEQVKYLNSPEGLENMYDEFVERMGESYKEATPEEILGWKELRINRIHHGYGQQSHLRYNPAKNAVETSQGLSFPVLDCLPVWSRLKSLPDGENDVEILGFRGVTKTPDQIRIGCHKLAIVEMNTIYNQLLTTL
jgi:hypothetical protein